VNPADRLLRFVRLDILITARAVTGLAVLVTLSVTGLAVLVALSVTGLRTVIGCAAMAGLTMFVALSVSGLRAVIGLASAASLSVLAAFPTSHGAGIGSVRLSMFFGLIPVSTGWRSALEGISRLADARIGAVASAAEGSRG
jgi:hypothetical protein